MRVIKVTYRAVFEQPKGVLNPSGWKISGAFPIEVYGTGERWKIRSIATATRPQYVKLGEHPGPTAAIQRAENSFQTQLQHWQVWGTPPLTLEEMEAGAREELRQLEPSEFKTIIKEGIERAYWLEPEDFTHIIHAPTLEPKQKVPHAACGVSVPADCFISTKANVEPTCKECAAVWREHYQGKKSA